MKDIIRQTINDINGAFSRNEGEAFLDFCTDDVSWTIPGEATLVGKPAILKFLSTHKCPDPPVIGECQILVDGNSAACYGEMTMGTEGRYSFCDIYGFAGDKVANLTSFVISIPAEAKTESINA